MLVILVSVVIVISSVIGLENIDADAPKTTPWQNTQFGGESLGYNLLEKDDEVSFEQRNTTLATRKVAANLESSSPTVLSRPSQLSAQIMHLDARDVVECYIVTRLAQLEDSHYSGGEKNVEGVHRMLDDSKALVLNDSPRASLVNANSVPPESVLIRKSALAFRHRPRVASASPTDRSTSASTINEHERQKYFELTLEYGPLHSGTAESMPSIRMNVENGSNSTGKHVFWDNKSRLYHSTRISNEWIEAYYMAQITGVVLEKIIQRAVEYVHKRPRYQPFDVVSVPSGDMILRGSSSDDFVWEMFHDLADFFVDIDPLLLPPRHRIQIYVADTPEDSGGERSDSWNRTGSRVTLNANVEEVRGSFEGDQAATFYEKFFNCANAIKAGNNSLNSPLPTSNRTFLLNTSAVPSIAPSIDKILVVSTGIGDADGSNVVRDQNETAAVEAAKNTSSSSHLDGKAKSTSALAQVADDATVAVISKAGGLVSGDGFLMTSALSSCFSDPKYGIRINDDKSRDTTIAYVYVDGDVYFRLNLTAPYLGITTVWETVPPPHIRPQGRGDAVDWAILTLIVMGALSGIIIMVYQWEKSPLKVKKGGGFPHSAIFLTTESIPSSMGGEGRSKISSVCYCDQVELTSPQKKGGLDGLNKKRKLSSLNVLGITPTPTNRKSDYAKLDHFPSSLKMEMETATNVIDRLSTRSNTKVSSPKKQVKFDESYDPQLEFSIDDEMAIV